MPFSPLIGISFLFHLVFAIADAVFCAWKRHAAKRASRPTTGTDSRVLLGDFPDPLRMNEPSYER